MNKYNKNHTCKLFTIFLHAALSLHADLASPTFIHRFWHALLFFKLRTFSSCKISSITFRQLSSVYLFRSCLEFWLRKFASTVALHPSFPHVQTNAWLFDLTGQTQKVTHRTHSSPTRSSLDPSRSFRKLSLRNPYPQHLTAPIHSHFHSHTQILIFNDMPQTPCHFSTSICSSLHLTIE